MTAIAFENGIWIVVFGLAIPLLLLLVVLVSFKKPAQGQALIRSGLGGTRVSFSGLVVLPLIQKAEFMDITMTRLVIDRNQDDVLVCSDGTRIDVKAAFFVRVKPSVEEVSRVVQTVGIKGASDIQVLYDLFSTRFIETLIKVSSQYDFAELSDREFFKEQIMSRVDLEPEGYILDVVAIDELVKSDHDN